MTSSSARWVRVRDERTGHEYTVSALQAEIEPALHVLEKPAVGPDGHLLPAKPRIPKAPTTKPTQKPTTIEGGK